jgi:purine nucleosidase
MTVAGAVMIGGAIGGTDPAGAGSGRPVPVVYDSDMDFDDASTLAYLCEEHKHGRIDLRAVTVVNNGFGWADRTLRHARSILEQCDLPHAPVAEGATGAGVHSAPPELVATIETVLTGALGDAASPPYRAPLSAPELITRVVLRSA